jgi:hypothetical protein
MNRLIAALAALALLTACGGIRDDLTGTPEPIGNFLLGHNIAVAETPQKGPLSRDASSEEWIAAMEKAVGDRFSRYDGDAYYHIAVAIEGYVLALPGIPLVYSPKSVLIFSVTFYRDSTQSKLNPEPIQLTVFEPCCSVPFIGSGLTKSAEQQMEGLTFNAARAIERTMRENGQWFGTASEAQEPDPTIVSGNVLVDNPAAVAPAQQPGQLPPQPPI